MISAIATDPARPGRVAVAWPEASGSDSSRIVLRSSADGGRTWSPRVDVADDPPTRPNQHDHVTLTWLSDGRLVALWRDHRCCGGAFDSRYQEFARTLGPDASGRLAVTGPAIEFTDGPRERTTDRRGSLMPDEFQGLVAGGGAVMASWAQVTGDFTDVVFRRVPLTAFGPPPASRANACGTVSRRRGRLAALVVGRRTARGVRLVPRHGRVYVRLCAPQTVRDLRLTLRGDRNRLFGRGRARRVSGRRTISIRLVRRFTSGTHRLAIVGRNPDGRVGRLTAQLLLTAPRQ
jgi:hypothetical protein